MVYLITYDLRVPGRDYTPLYNAIKKYEDWQHPVESTWFISSNHQANDIYNYLFSFIDSNDRLLVIQVDRINKQGWLAKSFWDWFNSK
jgi:hypothetical protein